MSNHFTCIVAGLLLSILFVTAFTSALGDSITMDELAHIPAGYSYVSQKDFRINPEHPPLAKDLAALPLLGLNLNFPSDHPSWTEGVNQQWWLGYEFLFNSGNNPDDIAYWSRIPMILILMALAFFVFFWARKLGGNETGLLALALISFSPTFLAHGRLVTTDVAAAFGVVLSSYFWIKFLKNPKPKTIFAAGIAWGIAMLLKFSLILLVPLFVIITAVFVWAKLRKNGLKAIFQGLFRHALLFISIALIAIVFVIWPVYQLHILNYPVEKQVSDTTQILESSPMPAMKNLCIWMAGKPITRPIAHYLLGLLMATQRTAAGNTVFFLGDISASGWWYYFPVVFFLKLPLAFLILALIALLWGIGKIKGPVLKDTLSKLSEWIKKHLVEFTMLVFLLIYWTTSITGNLNIGVRHILPTYPFLYILVSLAIVKIMKSLKKEQKYFALLIVALMFWYVFSSLTAWPHYLTYFNEVAGGSNLKETIVGGSDQGYKFVVDSNYDWGQDLKRLRDWADMNKIPKLYVDYFGGSDPEYYLGSKYEKWEGTKSSKEFPRGNYLVVSATLLQGGRGEPVHGFNQESGYYEWLSDRYLLDKSATKNAGNSMLIFFIE